MTSQYKTFQFFTCRDAKTKEASNFSISDFSNVKNYKSICICELKYNLKDQLLYIVKSFQYSQKDQFEQNNLGVIFKNGTGTPKNIQESIFYFKKAIQLIQLTC